MLNLIKMDLYRLSKAKSFRVCLIIAAVFALGHTPIAKLLSVLGRLLGSEIDLFRKTVNLSEIIGNPFTTYATLLCLLSASSFCYADLENGYIKNIAGQMPKKGYTILSKFIALIPHTLLFMVTCVICNLIGSVIFQKIIVDGKVLSGIGTFFLKFLLAQSLCSIIIMTTSVVGSKSLGTVMALLLGMGFLGMLYFGIDAGLNQLFKSKSFSVGDYMPDQLLDEANPKALRSILSAVITCVLFLPASVKLFDKKDVK